MSASRFPVAFLVLSSLVASYAAQATSSQRLGRAGERGALTIVPLVEEGDVIAGVGTVTTVANFAVNDAGSWIVEADTDAATTVDSVLVKDGATLLVEGQALAEPAGATIDTFDTVSLNNGGDSGWNFFLDGTTGSSDDSGLYFNTDLLIQEGASSTAAGLSPGTPYRGFFEAKVDDLDQLLYIASVDDVAIPSSVDQVLMLATTDAGNLTSETVLAREGTILPGQTEAIATFATNPQAFALDTIAGAMFMADLAGSLATDGVVYMNSTLIAQEGSPSPVAGRNWALGTATTAMDLNASGSYVLKGALDGPTSSNTLIVKDGVKLVQEGDTLPAIAPFTFTSLGTGPVKLGDDGTVLWYGEWNDPDTDVNSALFLDDEILVQEGVTKLDGRVIDTLRGITDGYTLSDGGLFVIFEAVLVDGTEGAYLARRPYVRRATSPLLKSSAAPGGSTHLHLDAGLEQAGRTFALFQAEAVRGASAPSWSLERLGVLDGLGRSRVPLGVPSAVAQERFFVVLGSGGLPLLYSEHLTTGR